jgi:hypothetical protein
VVIVLLLLELEHRSGSFIFLVSFYYFEAGCNWYYLDIIIYSKLRNGGSMN